MSLSIGITMFRITLDLGTSSNPVTIPGDMVMARHLVGDLLRGAFFVVPVAVAFNDVVGSASTVSGRSMQPTLNPHAIG